MSDSDNIATDNDIHENSPERELQFEQTFERIKKATATRTQVQLAEILGIRQSSISDAKRRCSVPADWFLKLYRKYGLNPDWLEYGIDPVYLKSIDGQVSAELLETIGTYGQSFADPKGKIVPAYLMTGISSADPDWDTLDAEKIYIPDQFHSPSLRVVIVDGSSMEPIICKGAYAGIDQAQKKLIAGEIYAINAPHQGLTLKRVFWDAQQNHFILKSEDPNHPEQFLSIEQQQDNVVGRVVWVLQKL